MDGWVGDMAIGSSVNSCGCEWVRDVLARDSDDGAWIFTSILVDLCLSRFNSVFGDPLILEDDEGRSSGL